jgi:cyclopropane fatty-acyl-phospholipid synthase-like methyltransferase
MPARPKRSPVRAQTLDAWAKRFDANWETIHAPMSRAFLDPGEPAAGSP